MTVDASPYELIRQLLYRYAEAVDSRNVNDLVALFVPDVQVGRDRSGRDALAEWFSEVLRSFGISAHFVGNHRITLIDDDHATGAVYCRAEHEVDGRWVVMLFQYWDVYERIDGEWMFRRRREKIWYSHEAADNPLADLMDRWPGRDDTAATLPESWPSWNAFWDESAG
jgi:ketosteroid isomerase-like protein